MTDRDRYKETFSQVHSRRTLNWEEFERMERKRKKSRPLRLLAAAAAVALLIGAPTMGAIAANFLGLRDLLLPVALTGDWARPLSLSGYLDTPESQALAEWVQFQADYDPDHTILDSVGNTLDPSLANYNAYLVYTPEMADRLEEIAAKYDLKLHSASYDGADHPELVEPLGNFLGQANGQVTYMYEDGTFHVDGWAQLTTDGYEPVEFQLQRSQAERSRLELTVPQRFFAWPGDLVRLDRTGLGCNGVYRVLEAAVELDGQGGRTRLVLGEPESAL